MSAKDYRMITEPGELVTMVAALEGKEAVGFDVETGYAGEDREKGALRPHEGAFISGFSVSGDPSWARWIPLRHDEGPTMDPATAWEIMAPVLTTGNRVVAHNAQFETRMLRTEGLELSLRSDTMLEAFLCARYKDMGLKDLVKRCFAHDQPEITSLFPPDTTKKKLKAMRFNTLPSDRPDVVAYACEDAAWCLALHALHFEEAMGVAKGGLFKVDHALVPILADMADWGVAVDWESIAVSLAAGKEFSDAFEIDVRAGLEEMLRSAHGMDASLDTFKAKKDAHFNLGSTHQLGKLFFSEEGLALPPVKLTDTGKPSTDAIALNVMAQDHEPVNRLLKLREVWNLVKRHEKWLNDYQGATDGRVHSSYGQTTVTSARFNASDPAIQQIPKKWGWSFGDVSGEEEIERRWTGNFRSFVVAPPGHYYLGFDYSQIELRFMAGVARETALLEAFNRGDDVHSLTAAMMLSKDVRDVDRETERPLGKTMNFALLYQMGVKSLADRLGVSRERAQELYDGYFRGFPAIEAWQSRVTREGIARSGTINVFGRKATVWELMQDDMRHKGERMLVNIPIQGAAADYMRIAMVRAAKALRDAGLWGERAKLVLNLHDALTFEIRNDVHPQTALDLLVPAVEFPVQGMPRILSEWDIGPSWGEATEFDYEDVEFEYTDRWCVVGADPQPVDIPVDNGIEDPEAETLDLPERPETVHLPVPEPQPTSGPRLVVEVTQMPFRVQWERFLKMVAERPGDVPLVLRCPEGESELFVTTSLTPHDASKIGVALPGARLFYPEGAVDLRAMEGMTL